MRREQKHLKIEKVTKRKKQRKFLKILSVIFLVVLAVAAFTVIRDYKARPGFLEKVWISGRGADYINVSWERVRNVDKYIIMYDDKTVEVSGRKKGAKISGLEEDTYYKFSIRADSKKREGFDTLTASARTKKRTHITGNTKQTRFANMPVDLKQTAETPVSYVPAKGYTVNEDGKVVFKRSGRIRVTAVSEETEEYASDKKVITVDVLDTISVDGKSAEPHIFYHIDKDNCDLVMTVTGSKTVTGPQSFDYDGEKYVSVFIKEDKQRIINFGEGKDGKKVIKPKMDLGHSNGFTIADGIYYSVRGGGSATCVKIDPKTEKYESFELPHPASGIAYDRKAKMFYTSQRGGMVAYDDQFNVVSEVNRMYRKTTNYFQDCGAYSGIMMHCVSGEHAQATNYIDFYDMVNGKYMGTVECELNELESIFVDDKGYIELLCNTKYLEDCIWKTPINMKKLCN